MNQMRGGFSNELAELRQQLIDFAALVELELDFGEEDVEFADRGQLRRLMDEIRHKISRLIESFTVGNAIKNGIPVVIAGKPNAGKSTLLNALLMEEKAIVSDIAGTTRDVIEDEMVIEGLRFRFIDTAGLRQTKDTIEAIGVERSYAQMKKADLILYLIDTSQGEKESQLAEMQKARNLGIPLIPILNKSDLIDEKQKLRWSDIRGSVWLSARDLEQVENLKKILIEQVNLPEFQAGDTIVTNSRHYQSLQLADDSLVRANEAIEAGISGDLLAMDIRQALHHLGEITGEISNEEVLGSIFSRFCIGK
jgi:tRNA modification GTPase